MQLAVLVPLAVPTAGFLSAKMSRVLGKKLLRIGPDP